MLATYLPQSLKSYIPSSLPRSSSPSLKTGGDTTDSNESNPRVAIIGAGVSGISAAAHITDLGYDCRIFEAGGEESIGGIWTNVNSTSGLQISSHFYHPHPSVHWTSEYPSQAEIIEQIRQLWLRFGLPERTRFHCPVQSVSRADGKWLINDGSDGLFDGIIAAIGTCGPARSCYVPGQEHFKGDIVHSTQLDGIDLNGKIVAVVGGGASAVEALEHANDHGAAKVKILSRSEKWMIPRWRPFNLILAASLSGPFTFWATFVGELLRWLFYGRDCGHVAPRRGSKQHVYSSTPIVNSRALELIRSGKAEWVKSDCLRFDENGIVIRPHYNGSRCASDERSSMEPCDVCIQATGFSRPTLHFLEEYHGAYQPPNWYMQVFPPGEPTICALNATWREAFGSVGGSQIGLLTRLLLVFLLDPSTQPTQEAMENWVEFMMKWKHGLRFITQLEMYLFLVVAIAGDWRLWRWASFIVSGADMPKRRGGRRASATPTH